MPLKKGTSKNMGETLQQDRDPEVQVNPSKIVLMALIVLEKGYNREMKGIIVMSKAAFEKSLKVLKQNLKDELASDEPQRVYIDDLKFEIEKIKLHISRYEYAEKNGPYEMVDK